MKHNYEKPTTKQLKQKAMLDRHLADQNIPLNVEADNLYFIEHEGEIEFNPYSVYFDKGEINAIQALTLFYLDKNLGVVSPTRKSVGISHQTFYNWKNKNPFFKKHVEELQEIQVDFVEQQFLKSIKRGNTQAQIFYLKTKARDRGYQENINVEQTQKIEGFEFIEVSPENNTLLENKQTKELDYIEGEYETKES